MPSIMNSLIFILSILPITLAVSVPTGKKQSTPIHIHTYTNPATTSDCNLECRRAFCISVSQFLESVTCTSHRPCLSLMLQYQIQEKCLNWRPEVHSPTAVSIDAPVKSKIDTAARSKDDMDSDCMDSGPASPGAEWVKPYVPAAEAHEWEEEDAQMMSVGGLGDEMSCIVVLRWMCFVGVVVALFYAWQARDRKERGKEIMDRRAKGKGEM